MIPTECCMFNKGPLGDEVTKCRGGDKEVTFSFDFTNPGLACCMGHSERKCVGVFIEKSLDECSFTDARWSRNDDGPFIPRRCCRN